MADHTEAPPPTAFELPTVGALAPTIQHIRQALVVQPKPDALGTAQVSLLPLLYACGIDIFDLRAVRCDGLPTSQRVRYRIALADDAESPPANDRAIAVAVEVAAVGDTVPPPEVAAGAPWALATNGAEWHLLDAGSASQPVRFSLFSDIFPTVALTLFAPPSGTRVAARAGEARALLGANSLADKLEQLVAKLGADSVRRQAADTSSLLALLQRHGLAGDTPVPIDDTIVQEVLAQQLNATQLGFVRPARPMTHISYQDVARHAEVVANLRGGLEATFDGEPIEIRSRSSLYFVLAALALQFGREDAIPPEDLIRPPQPVPERRHRPLGRPGWYLLLEREQDALETAVADLLDKLRLRQRLQATHRNKPFPNR